MGSFVLPASHAVAEVNGAGTGVAIPCGIDAGDTLLAVIQVADATCTGLNPAAFTVAQGSVQSATVDTSGKRLVLVYTNR